MNSHSSLLDFQDSLLDCIEGGEFHERQKVGSDNPLPIENFLEIGRILKSCASRPKLFEELINKLGPHRDVIIGKLPAGVQRYGLVPDAEESTADDRLRELLREIPSHNIRQWIIDDGSLIYGELSKEELRDYFLKIEKLLNHRRQFIDFGSGLGKVVLTASVRAQFDSYLGVELMPYRHRLAIERFDHFRSTMKAKLALQSLRGFADMPVLKGNSVTYLEHLNRIPESVDFRLCDMFDCDIQNASLIFIYSTCFGTLMHKIADKLVNQSPEGCLVSATTYSLNHPGLKPIAHYPAKSVAWTEIRVYERVGVGPWDTIIQPSAIKSDLITWETEARKELTNQYNQTK